MWIKDLLDEISIQQLLYFFSYSLVALWCKYSPFLLPRFAFWVYVETMLNDLPINPWHILVFPSESILVSLKKEIIFSFFLKLGVLFRSLIPSSNLLRRSQLLVVFLTLQEWVLVH